MTVSVKLQLKYLVILQILATRGGEDKQAKQLSWGTEMTDPYPELKSWVLKSDCNHRYDHNISS